MNRDEIIESFHLTDCRRCENECAVVCPIYDYYGSYYPQELARIFLDNDEEGVAGYPLLWFCVGCRRCTESCPFDVEYGEFIKRLRVGRGGYKPAYEGLLQNIQRLQAGSDDLNELEESNKERLEKRKKSSFLYMEDLDINGSKEIALFVGCIPYFEKIFGEEDDFCPKDTVTAAIKVLNEAGISPQIFEDERCCGCDSYNLGERKIFFKLAEHNIGLLRDSGVETVITVCPECAYTLKVTYRKHFGEMPFRVVNFCEYIASKLDSIDFEVGDDNLAFHDPCYLGRYQGIYSAPRSIIDRLSSKPLIELENKGAEAVCCGAGSFANHGRHNRGIVNARLLEAHRCGADLLVTGCPRCTILFQEVNPPGSWKQSPVEVMDFVKLIESRMRVLRDGNE